jgi:flagellar biosynthesis/type III secretory pathway protein FliH
VEIDLMDGLASAFLRDAPADFGRGGPGILYVEDFDAPPPRDRRAPDIITPSFTHAELEAAREEGFKAGLATAQGEHHAVQTELRTAALTAIGEALAAARGEAAAVAQHMAGELVSTVLALVEAALPAAASRLAGAEIAALLACVLPPLKREPALTVRVHPDVHDETEDAIARIWPDHLTRVAVIPDGTLAASDVVVTWSDGEARRETAALWEAIRAALTPCALPALDTILEGMHHGG